MNGDRPVETSLSDLISKALTIMREGSFSMDLCSNIEAHHFPPDVVKAIGDRFPNVPSRYAVQSRKFAPGDVVRLRGSYNKMTIESFYLQDENIGYYNVVWFDARATLMRARLPDAVMQSVPDKKSRVNRYGDDED